MVVYLPRKEEKIVLMIKLIDLYLNSFFSSDEIHHIFQVLVYSDISKDSNFSDTKLLEYIQNIVNIEFAFYTNDLEAINSEPELFGEQRLKEMLINLKDELETNLLA